VEGTIKCNWVDMVKKTKTHLQTVQDPETGTVTNEGLKILSMKKTTGKNPRDNWG